MKRIAAGLNALGLALALVFALPLSLSRPAAPPAAAQVSDQAQVGLQAVEAALNLLVTRYVQPLDRATLLDAGWRGAREAAPPGLAADASAELPRDGAAAWAEFETRFRTLVTAGAEPGSLARGANRAMARSLADCHTSFAESFEKEMEFFERGERYGGIGTGVQAGATFDPPAPGPVVTFVVDGGPAQAAGVRPGDAVLAVDGTDIAGLSHEQVVALVRGPPGTLVRLRLDRPGESQPVELVVERALIEMALLEWRYIPPAAPGGAGTGYVKLRSFVQPVEPALAAALEQLRALGAGGYVLDLRQNGGGEVRTFVNVASTFIQEGPLGVTVDRAGIEATLWADARHYKPFAQPLAVLVDRQSASASELFAADVQEYGIARVFGLTTAGCFGNSQLFRLPDGSALWLTVRALQSGLGRRDVHKIGVTPDEVIGRSRADLASGRDPQLARALEWLGAPGADEGA